MKEKSLVLMFAFVIFSVGFIMLFSFILSDRRVRLEKERMAEELQPVIEKMKPLIPQCLNKRSYADVQLNQIKGKAVFWHVEDSKTGCHHLCYYTEPVTSEDIAAGKPVTFFLITKESPVHVRTYIKPRHVSEYKVTLEMCVIHWPQMTVMGCFELPGIARDFDIGRAEDKDSNSRNYYAHQPAIKAFLSTKSIGAPVSVGH